MDYTDIVLKNTQENYISNSEFKKFGEVCDKAVKDLAIKMLIKNIMASKIRIERSGMLYFANIVFDFTTNEWYLINITCSDTKIIRQITLEEFPAPTSGVGVESLVTLIYS